MLRIILFLIIGLVLFIAGTGLLKQSAQTNQNRIFAWSFLSDAMSASSKQGYLGLLLTVIGTLLIALTLITAVVAILELIFDSF